MSDETPVPGELAIGDVLAGYRLDEVIARGGMAVVYGAFDERLGRSVALKVLAAPLARDEAFRQRFIRESRVAAAVDHPNIVPIFGAGEAEGVLYIAMRLVHGRDVLSLIERHGRLPAARACHIVTQVASALDAAHARGLVHRDVKPANMLRDATTGDEDSDHVYLSDFGLSKNRQSSSHLTYIGEFLGTMDYVAPEQIEGRVVDGRSDQYALACSAFEMLSGAPPFKQDETMAVMWAQVSATPPALTSRRPDLPAAVDPVFAKALAKAPDDRYGTCLEFASALRRACGLGRETAEPAPPRHPPTLVADVTAPAAPPSEDAAPPAAGGPAGQPEAPRPAGIPEVAAAAVGAAAAEAGAEAVRAAANGAETPSAVPGAEGAPAPVPASGDDPGVPPHDPTEQIEAVASAPAPAEATAVGDVPPALLPGPAERASAAAPAAVPPVPVPAEATAVGDIPAVPPADRTERIGAVGAAAVPAAAAPAAAEETALGEIAAVPVIPAVPPAGRKGRPGKRDRRGPQGPRQNEPGPYARDYQPSHQLSPAERAAPPRPPRPPEAYRLPPLKGARPRRTRMAVLIACVALLGAVAGAYAAFGGGASGTTATVAAPGCTTKAATAPAARRVPQHSVRTGGKPFDVAVTSSGTAFVSLGTGIAVLHATGAVPTLMNTVPVAGQALGETLTPNQKYLLVTGESGLTVYRVSKLEQDSTAARGTLTTSGRHAVQVAASPDGHFAFVTLQFTHQVAVFNVRKALTSGFGPSDLVGLIPVGADPIGITASPNGRYLYVASGLATPTQNSGRGFLTVIDLHKAETSPGSSVLQTVNAGCGPDRVAVSANGDTVWVSAGGANAVVAFSAAKLLSDPAHALIARVAVGQVPLGLVLVNGGSRLIVADSNRDNVKGGVSSLAVIDVRRALAGRPALTGIIATGATPRQFALEPGGRTLLVVNTDAGQIQADKITHLP